MRLIAELKFMFYLKTKKLKKIENLISIDFNILKKKEN